MTCIVAVAENGVVTMGADSLVAEGWQINAYSAPLAKIIRREGMLIASSGASRIAQAVAFDLELTDEILPEPSDPVRYLVRIFIPALRDCLWRNGCLQNESGVNRAYADGTDTGFVIGMAGRVFLIYPAFDLMENTLGYVASGSGAEVALGAVYASRLHGNSSRQQVMNGLRAASEFIMGIREPFVVEELVS